MNTDLKDLKPILIKASKWLKRYMLIISFIVVSLIYGGLVIQINLLNRKEPTDAQFNEKIQKITQPKIDEATVLKLKQLESNSDEVKALFKEARENPFQE